MIKLRLRRMGAKKQPSYRIVAAESTAPRDGAFIETIGHYNPVTDPATIKVDEEKALKWLMNGAQPTETVAKLFTKVSVMEKFQAAKQHTP
ncbi:MAG: 30S ribosomal protein S16 [Chloroflexota bacterium]|nr:MAG: 30S ribosomal protein S16 [Chloroflexota bacterium]